jgi:hypothetical protein
VGDEATARPRPVVGGAKIGAGHSAHAEIAELAASAMSARPARVRARPLTEPMNARYFTGHTPIISGDVRTRMLLSSHFGPAAESNRLPRSQRTRYDRPAKHPGLKHRNEFLRDLSRAARGVGWVAGDGVGGLRHLAIPSGEGLPPDRYCAFIYMDIAQLVGFVEESLGVVPLTGPEVVVAEHNQRVDARRDGAILTTGAHDSPQRLPAAPQPIDEGASHRHPHDSGRVEFVGEPVDFLGELPTARLMRDLPGDARLPWRATFPVGLDAWIRDGYRPVTWR